MDMRNFFANEDERPLEHLVTDGGFCGIFRRIGCVGDSLSSGEFESLDANGNKTYHDFYDYSWGQYLARMAGCTAYNFSRGGMTAIEYCQSFAEQNDFWNPDKACQAYIIALGVNDLVGQRQTVGSAADIPADWRDSTPATFAGWYAQIILRLREIEPHARFFLMTMPRGIFDPAIGDAHAALLHEFAAHFPHTYVIDLRKYAPENDAAYVEKFYLGGHLNPCGYLLTAQMTASYIDYIIRHNMDDFTQAGFIGTPYYRDELDAPAK